MAHRGNKAHITGWRAILLAPIALPIAVFAGLFSKPAKRTPSEVAGFIRDFLDGSGAPFDWDDFTSVPIADAELESLRRQADRVYLPLTPAGRSELEKLQLRAEELKSAWIAAGEPE